MKVVGKKYPRIYSISTVGIRNHNNADFLIHPLRTDFTGESTTGKSLIGADLPQLILTAGKFYKSATPPKGNVPREFNTLPIPTGLTTSLPFAYAFMNIQIGENEFIVIGVQIKHSRKILIPFIIQGEKYLGYGEKENPDFKPLKKIIRYKDFLINGNEMPPIDNLKDHLDRQEIFLKSFYEKEEKDLYHKLLYDNEILHLDLSKDENLQKQFANTLQSLSRGENIDTKGRNFKKFLFHYDNKVEDKFNKESEEIQQSHRNFQSNTQKHFSFTEKKQNLKDLLELKIKKDEANEARIKSETAYRHQKVTEQDKLLKEARESFFQTELETLGVREKKIFVEIAKHEADEKIKTSKLAGQKKDFETASSDFDNYKNELEGLNTAVPILEGENNKLKNQYDKFQQAEIWVKDYSSVPNVRMKFETQSDIIIQKQKLTELNEFLKLQKMTKEFEESEYSKSIHKATEFYLQKKNELTNQISGIEKLKSIIDKQQPNSFAGWAVSSKKKLNELQESVLFHFATNPVTKFNETENYIPEPSEFIEALKQVKETKTGFVINLSGLHYHIAKRPNYIFAEPDELEKEIKRIGKDYQTEINKLQSQLDKIEKLQEELIQTFKYSEEHLSAYLNREEIQVNKTDDSFLNFTPTLFDEVIEIYQADIKKKEEQKIRTLYEKANKEYADKLGRQNICNEKMNSALATKKIAEGNIASLTEEIAETQKKITALKNIKLTEIEISFITWKSNLYNPFKENHEKMFQRHKTAYKTTSDENELTQKEVGLARKSGEEGGRIKSIIQIIPQLKKSFENQSKEYEKHFNKTFDTDELIVKISDDDLTNLKAAELNTANDYKNKYKSIIQNFPAELRDNPVMKEHNLNFRQLLYELIPRQLITNHEKPEESLMNDIENHLLELNQKINLLNEEEVNKIHSTIHLLKEIVDKHILDLGKVQAHFKDFKLANHHKVELEFGLADDYDLNWLRKFKDDSQNASFMKSFGFKETESAYGILERIFKQYCPFVKDPKAYDILDPFNYYTARAKLIDTTGAEKAPTGGTGYGLLALIGIAKLSLVEGNKNIRDVKPGIRILPIDEVAGLGGNFELLYELAKELDYQIFTMTISPQDLRFRDGEQIYYEFIESANPDKPYLNEGVYACFSKADQTIDIEKYFSDKIFRLPNVVSDVV